MKGFIRTAVIPVSLLTAALAVTEASGAILTLEHTTAYSGSVPSGPAPWLIATFTDVGPDSVTLTLDASSLQGDEFVTLWAFNLHPALDPRKLTFSTPTKTGTFADPDVTRVADGVKAGSAHGFDFKLDFNPSKKHRFGADEKATFTLGGIAGLSASSFDYSSASGSVRYKAGVHVQGLTDGGSGWVAPAVAAVPEPGTTAFVALAAGLVAARRRR